MPTVGCPLSCPCPLRPIVACTWPSATACVMVAQEGPSVSVRDLCVRCMWLLGLNLCECLFLFSVIVIPNTVHCTVPQRHREAVTRNNKPSDFKPSEKCGVSDAAKKKAESKLSSLESRGSVRLYDHGLQHLALLSMLWPWRVSRLRLESARNRGDRRAFIML